MRNRSRNTLKQEGRAMLTNLSWEFERAGQRMSRAVVRALRALGDGGHVKIAVDRETIGRDLLEFLGPPMDDERGTR